MAQIVKELRVDVSQPNVFQAIVAKQHDSNSRFLKITLVDFGVKVEVPNTAKVTINANRPDGASESFKGEANNDGTITVPLAQWMLDIDGEVKCDVSVTNTEDNKRLTSTDFWLEVQKAANPNASIPLDPDGEILIIKPVTEINGNSKDTDYPSAKAVYDYGQNIVTDTQITATATGSAITIESSQAPLQNLKLYGKTTQDGIPTPDNPIELKSVGDSGSFEVGVYGKNLFVPLVETRTNDGLTIATDEFGTITVNGTLTKAYSIKVGSLTYKGRLTLTPNFNGEINGSYFLFYPIDEKPYTTGKNPITFDKTLNTPININIVFNVGTYTNLVIKPMINIGATSLPYEPFNQQLITNNDTLRGIGDIADEIDFARGVKIQRMGFVKISNVITGEVITLANGNKGVVVQPPNKRNGANNVLMCTNAKRELRPFTNADGTFYENPGNLVFCGNSTDTYTTLKTKYGEGYLLYELETPIETPISETELNAYRQLMTNKGTTTILSEADMEVDYYINKPNAQAIGNIHSQVNKDYFKLQQAIISTGGSTL